MDQNQLVHGLDGRQRPEGNLKLPSMVLGLEGFNLDAGAQHCLDSLLDV